MRKRGELDGIAELAGFADFLEKACVETIESGRMIKGVVPPKGICIWRCSEMTAAWVMLKTIKDLQDFVNLVSNYGCRMELVARHQVINAKSIIGVLSMDITKPLELRIYDGGKDIEEILQQLKKYRIDGVDF